MMFRSQHRLGEEVGGKGGWRVLRDMFALPLGACMRSKSENLLLFRKQHHSTAKADFSPVATRFTGEVHTYATR